jgi:hypothetical protein
MHGVRSTAWFAAGKVRATAGKDPSGPGGGSQDFLKTRQIFASRKPGVSGQRAVFRRTPPHLDEKQGRKLPGSRAEGTPWYSSGAGCGCRPLSGANLRFPISATRAESRQPGFMAGKPPEVGTAPRGLLFQPCVQPVTGWFVSRQSAGIPTAPNRREKSRRISRPRVRREHPWFLCQ